MEALKPYADDAAALTIGGLTLENGRDRIALYGNLDLTRDKAGLEHARALKAALDGIVRALEAEPSLPAKAATPKPPGSAKNPFG